MITKETYIYVQPKGICVVVVKKRIKKERKNYGTKYTKKKTSAKIVNFESNVLIIRMVQEEY